MADYYDTLGVPRGASEKDIRGAFRRLARKHHPDVNDSDPLEDWCANAPGTCGIMTPQDDSDDATGSFHQACIINTSLTHAGDSGLITWDIVAVAGSPLPTAVSITELAGPLDDPNAQPNPILGEPCVSWSTGFTGVQNITAVYDNGVDQAGID